MSAMSDDITMKKSVPCSYSDSGSCLHDLYLEPAIGNNDTSLNVLAM